MFIVAAVLTLNSCAAKNPPGGYKQFRSIQFRNCEIVEKRDNQNSCECRNIEWIRDKDADRWIALCIKPSMKTGQLNYGVPRNEPDVQDLLDLTAAD